MNKFTIFANERQHCIQRMKYCFIGSCCRVFTFACRQEKLVYAHRHDVKGAESGSSILHKDKTRKSERVYTCIWCGFLFHVFFFMGFARTLLLESVDVVSTPYLII